MQIKTANVEARNFPRRWAARRLHSSDELPVVDSGTVGESVVFIDLPCTLSCQTNAWLLSMYSGASQKYLSIMVFVILEAIIFPETANAVLRTLSFIKYTNV